MIKTMGGFENCQLSSSYWSYFLRPILLLDCAFRLRNWLKLDREATLLHQTPLKKNNWSSYLRGRTLAVEAPFSHPSWVFNRTSLPSDQVFNVLFVFGPLGYFSIQKSINLQWLDCRKLLSPPLGMFLNLLKFFCIISFVRV